MNSIQTTGGVFTGDIKKSVIANIKKVFNCSEEEIIDLKPLQAGMTNIVLSFRYRGGKFVYRYPGLGSDILVDRGRETLMQSIVSDIGIDNTLIAMDVDDGWKIARFVEHYDFDYHDLNDMVRGVMLLRKLHDAPCKVRWDFDVLKKAAQIKSKIDSKDYGHFDHFSELEAKCAKLDRLANTDGISKCYIHGDARDVNFLVNKQEIFLTDWEYGGYGDPGFDLGSYIDGGDHSQHEIDQILFTYYRHEPTFIQRRHFYAYIAITGWFYMHWSMLKASRGQDPGPHKMMWYNYAMKYSDMALDMYKGENKQ